MAWVLYDYLDSRNQNEIKAWAQGLQKRERAKLNLKLNLLENNGSELSPHLLSDTKLRHIKEIRINGQVAIRLMVCKGPISMDYEFTLLVGAIEKDRKYIPRNVLEQAESKRLEIIASPDTKRCLHEEIE